MWTGDWSSDVCSSDLGGFLRRQEFGSGAVYSYDYDWGSRSYYPAKVRSEERRVGKERRSGGTPVDELRSDLVLASLSSQANPYANTTEHNDTISPITQ